MGFIKLRQALLPALLLGLLGAGISPAEAAKAIPAPPQYYVLDEPRALSPSVLRSLQSLLIEHDRTTGEQFIIAIFNTLEGEDPVDFTNRVFSAWRIGKRGKNNGVLLALYWKERKTRIEVGYGLEPLLTDAKSKLVLSDFLAPELKAGNPDRALSLSALEILRILESPLIHNGKAQEILRSGGLRGSWTPVEKQAGTLPTTVLLILGILVLLAVLRSLTAADAHYTGRGWYRPNPWRSRHRGGGFGVFGGGGFGGFGGGHGGGGGFRGGGGSSGGGGASGDW